MMIPGWAASSICLFARQALVGCACCGLDRGGQSLKGVQFDIDPVDYEGWRAGHGCGRRLCCCDQVFAQRLMVDAAPHLVRRQAVATAEADERALEPAGLPH